MSFKKKKQPKQKLKMAIFKLLVLSYMQTTLYISFFYSNRPSDRDVNWRPPCAGTVIPCAG